MPAPDYEVGMTYTKNGKYFLAVADKILVTLKEGEFQEISPYSRYEPCRNLSVENLCDLWDIRVSELDALSRRYFTPRDCHDANPSYRTAQRRNMNRPASIRVIRLAG
jgi:hypothetical protein